MGLARWFFYGTSSWSDQDAKRQLDRGQPRTGVQKFVASGEGKAAARKSGSKGALLRWGDKRLL